jgi:hypothetical protein
VEGARDPSLDNENVSPTSPFKPMNINMPFPDDVPGDLRLAGDINRIESVASRMH